MTGTDVRKLAMHFLFAKRVFRIREDARDAAEAADVVATDDVRMQAEIHPRLRFALEALDLPGGLEELGPGRFHRERHARLARGRR